MSNLVKLSEIQNTPAVIKFDYEGVKTVVQAHLAKYQSIVLTDDTYKDGKDLVKEINVSRKALEQARKDEVKKASEPIKAFEAQIKELVSLHDSLLDNLRVQIAKFEEEQKKVIESALSQALVDAWSKKGVRKEFQQSNIEHLILLGSFTATGNLTAKAKTEVEQLANNDFALQAQTDLRLSQIEALCYKAGLAAPLTEGHVRHFVFDDEVTYQTKLNALLASELEREQQAIQFRLSQEAEAKQLEEQRAQAEAQTVAQSEPEAKKEEVIPMYEEAPTIAARQSASGSVVIICTFSLENVPAHISTQSIEAQLKQKLIDAGFTTLTSMRIERA